MKKLIISAIFFSIFSTKILAQVSIVSQFNASNLSNLNELWNVMLINTLSTNKSGYLIIQVNNQNGDDIVTLQTAPFALFPGQNLISLPTQSTASIQYYLNSSSQYVQNNSVFAPGQYNCCYHFFETSDPASQVQSCFAFTNSSTLPLQLFSPFNGEYISTLNPDLIWIPPYPSTGIAYTVIVIPYDSTNSLIDNFLLNNPILAQSNISSTSIMYPYTAAALEYGSSYAWKVQAWLNNNLVGETAPWIFRIATSEQEEESQPDCYRVLGPEINQGHYLFGNILRFAYDNRSNDSTLSYSIKNVVSGETSNSPAEVILGQGRNKIDIDLTQLNLTTQKDYLLTITDSDQHSYSFIFRRED